MQIPILLGGQSKFGPGKGAEHSTITFHFNTSAIAPVQVVISQQLTLRLAVWRSA